MIGSRGRHTFATVLKSLSQKLRMNHQDVSHLPGGKSPRLSGSITPVECGIMDRDRKNAGNKD